MSVTWEDHTTEDRRAWRGEPRDPSLLAPTIDFRVSALEPVLESTLDLVEQLILGEDHAQTLGLLRLALSMRTGDLQVLVGDTSGAVAAEAYDGCTVRLPYLLSDRLYAVPLRDATVDALVAHRMAALGQRMLELLRRRQPRLHRWSPDGFGFELYDADEDDVLRIVPLR